MTVALRRFIDAARRVFGAVVRAVGRAIDLRDTIAAAGLGCAAYGLQQIHPPTAWIVVGAALFYLAAIKEPRN